MRVIDCAAVVTKEVALQMSGTSAQVRRDKGEISKVLGFLVICIAENELEK